MQHITHAGRAKTQWLLFGECNQLRHVARLHRRVHHQQRTMPDNGIGDGREIAYRVIGQLFVNARVDGEGHRDMHHGITIRRGLGHDVATDNAVGAAAVIHHDGLAHGCLHLLGQRARIGVRRTTRRKRHHQPDRTRRPRVLCKCIKSQQTANSGKPHQCRGQASTNTLYFHFVHRLSPPARMALQSVNAPPGPAFKWGRGMRFVFVQFTKRISLCCTTCTSRLSDSWLA